MIKHGGPNRVLVLVAYAALVVAAVVLVGCQALPSAESPSSTGVQHGSADAEGR